MAIPCEMLRAWEDEDSGFGAQTGMDEHAYGRCEDEDLQ